ncbi:MAG: recombinase family protein [Solirubrobacterales bacterium]|nr:recombinase family protein [Solirubrobacterales bacterium]
MADRAGRWLRVSTGGQDEQNQLPDIERWCESHGYETSEDTLYVAHAKRAYTGKHQAMLDRALNDMAQGKFDVLVVWALDRIERRGALYAFKLAARARECGGRIEYAAPSDSYLNETNDMSDVMLALAARQAQLESQRKSERIKIKHDGLRAAGSVVGGAPFGYQIELQPDGRKFLVPTADGRKYIPLIFARVIAGESLRSIAAWLDSENVSTRRGGNWHETYLYHRLIKNPVYMGQRRNSGQLETEALVSPTTFRQANAELASRAPAGRGTVTHEKALLKPVCGNCGSPMYRVMAGRRPYRKDYYRCSGKGPQRKGCGNMVPLAELDQRVIDAKMSNLQPHWDRVFIAGDDRSDEIARLRERGADAMRQGDYDAAMAAMREATELENAPRVRPHWEEQATDQTEADYFAGLDDDQRREYLARHDIAAHRDQDGELIVTMGPRRDMP